MRCFNLKRFSKFAVKLRGKISQLNRVTIFIGIIFLLFLFPMNAFSENSRILISAGGSNIWFGDDSAFAPVLDFAYDSTTEDKFGFGILIHIVGTPGDVGDLEGGGVQGRLMPYGVLKKSINEDLKIYYKIGPQLFPWTVGDDDAGKEGIWYGLRGGIELEKRLQSNKLIGELNLGYLAGETHFGSPRYSWDESDSGIDVELKLGYVFGDRQMISFYYNTISSGELDENFGSAGLLYTFIR